jgi:hypothetical protein
MLSRSQPISRGWCIHKLTVLREEVECCPLPGVRTPGYLTASLRDLNETGQTLMHSASLRDAQSPMWIRLNRCDTADGDGAVAVENDLAAGRGIDLDWRVSVG